MIVVVAEKPSVARDIARVLKCSRKEGWFESATHQVTWALGHLVTLQEPDELDEKYKKWRKEDLPILPAEIGTKVISKTRTQFSLVKKLMNDKAVTRVIAATDAGREGELIFRLIYSQAACKKPVDRLWISSLTDAAIREGLDALKPASAYEGLYQSALCRAQADWMVGMNASRAFTLQYNVLLSVGRVQTPTLAILVEREREIRAFNPQEFFTLTANFGDYEGQWVDLNAPDERTAHRIVKKEQAEGIRLIVKGEKGQVIKAETQPKRELPPQLFDLTSLQREANRVLGFTADKTLKVAQSLYEGKKALTYPRTDSRYLPNDMIPKVSKALDSLPDVYQPHVAAMPRKGGKLPYSRRIFDDAKVSDHHAIIPTPQKSDLSKFTADERALYDLVARRFIAAFYPAFEYDQTTVITQVKGEPFKSTGRVVTKEGWKAVIPPVRKKGRDEEETALPALALGDERAVKSTQLKQDTTKPPAPHTDASLLARMERPGAQVEDEELMETLKKASLGTPATRAATIERLIQVGYAARRGKIICATEKGERLIDVVPEDIASPVMTGKWEQALEEIARGERDPKRFMEGIRRLSSFLVEDALKEKKAVDFPKEVRTARGKIKAVSAAKPLEGMICPLCGKPVQETDRAFGCSDWKNGCSFTLWKNAFFRVKGPRLNEAIIRLLLTQGEARGSSGVLKLQEGQVSFIPNQQDQPAHTIPIRYVRPEKTDSKENTSKKSSTKRAAKKPKP
ncbi:MAG: DNA topoisomerase 3 [Clostridiales bacterium]|nr:DNA topoisomerase 3 [Clostridiales bacterium]